MPVELSLTLSVPDAPRIEALIAEHGATATVVGDRAIYVSGSSEELRRALYDDPVVDEVLIMRHPPRPV